MGFVKEYFPGGEGDPVPLTTECERRVRFEEVDGLSMVWHGRYPSYLEDGRIRFGDVFGLTYHSFRENKTVAPVVQMHLDYKVPLRFDEVMKIRTTLHWTESAKLNFSYGIFNEKGAVAASGYTIQLLTEIDGTVLLVVPQWLQEFRNRWRAGEFVL